jgi:hypothetical protein
LCNTGSNAQLRALEASPDEATTLNVLLDGTTIFSNTGLGTPTNSANFATSLTPILLTDNLTAPASGDFQLGLVNAASSAGPIDIYVVAPATAAGSVPATVTSLPFTSATSYQSLTARSYDVIFTQAGFPGVPYVQLSSVALERDKIGQWCWFPMPAEDTQLSRSVT